MKILLVCSEAAPFAKTCGIADAVTGLAKSLAELGHEVTLALPFYRAVIRDSATCRPTEIPISVQVGERRITGTVYESPLTGSTVRVLLIDQPEYFGRPALYAERNLEYADNCERFVFFSRAVLEAACALGFQPDVVHAHGWQTGLIPALVAAEFRQRPEFEHAAVVFTFHDLTHQGDFPQDAMALTGLDRKYFNWRQMECYGRLNLLKTGIVFADMVTTVCPKYAKQVCTPEFGCKLEGALAARGRDLVGILNGVDYRERNPATDRHLPETFDLINVVESKAACKAALQEELGLPVKPDLPLLSFVGRMVEQKGIDLIIAVMEQSLPTCEVQWVLLGGNGNLGLEQKLRELANCHPHKVAFHGRYDGALAHRIESGADMFLLPSRYEPCGVNSLNGILYGTVPIVSALGGVADSVINVTHETLIAGTATGFLIETHSAQDVYAQIGRAIETYRRPEVWMQIVKNNLRQDWSWRRTASEYANVYERSLRKRDAWQSALTSKASSRIGFTVVDSISVRRERDVARIELCVGDIMEMPSEDRVDVLVVSAFPDDYTPLPGSLIGTLDEHGVSVEQLSRNRAIDLRDQFSCWMSSALDASGADLPFRRILCFEPLQHGTPPERIGDIFRALAPFLFDAPAIRKLAMPILASGYHRQSPTIMLQLLVDTAKNFLAGGLPLECLKIVARPPFDLTEAERTDYITRIKQTFAKAKSNTATASFEVGRNAADFRYDLFVSYSRHDYMEVDYLIEQLHGASPGIRVFLDRTELSPGQAWQQEIYSALDSCWKVMPVYSPSFVQSKVCLEELNIALCRAREEDRPLVCPVYLYTTRLPTYMKLLNLLDCREFNREKLTDAGRSLLMEIQRK